MKPLADVIPPEILATPEERERAVMHWEHEIRPEISDEQPRLGNTILAEALRLAAAQRLEELHGEPIPKMGLGILRVLVQRGAGNFEIPDKLANNLLSGTLGPCPISSPSSPN
jgi:hypothetical protein